MNDQIIVCHKCDRKYQVSAHHAGKSFHCRECSELIAIPEIRRPQRNTLESALPKRETARPPRAKLPKAESRESKRRRSKQECAGSYFYRKSESNRPSVYWLMAIPAVILLSVLILSLNALWSRSKATVLKMAEYVDTEAGTARDSDASGVRSILLKQPPGIVAEPAFSSYPPRFVQSGQIVLDIANGQKVADLPADLTRGRNALSSDGKRVAHFNDPFGSKVAEITIYSSGNTNVPPVQIKNPDKTWRIDWMQFADDRRLITHAGSGQWIVWDSVSGQKLISFQSDQPNNSGFTLSTDGQLLAVAGSKDVQVYSTQSGNRTATMNMAQNGKRIEMSTCIGLAFAPDLSELAGVFVGGQLIVWSSEGNILIAESVSELREERSAQSRNVSYLPDKSGWFVSGNRLLDRKTMVVVWEIENVAPLDMHSCVLDQNTVMTTANRPIDQLLVFPEIPWQKIHAGLKDLEPAGEPFLKSGGSVSIQCHVSSVRFADVAQTKNSIAEMLRIGLEKVGLSVAENQPVSLVLQYAENAGDHQRKGEQANRRAPNPGFSFVDDTVITVSVEMRVAGRAEPIWRKVIREDTNIIENLDEQTPEAVRRKVFLRALDRIRDMGYPASVPNDKKRTGGALPVRTRL